MLNMLMLTALSGLGISSLGMCIAWCLKSAKYDVPIKLSDAKIMWVLHRKSAACAGQKWQPITRRKGKIIGFQCECGYKYTQKRPLVSRMPKRN